MNYVQARFSGMTTWTTEESKRYDVPLLYRSACSVHACKREEARTRDITDRKSRQEKIALREEKKETEVPISEAKHCYEVNGDVII